MNECKLLGTIITSDLRWEKNTQNIIKKANARMQLLHKIAQYSPPREDMLNIYILFVRSILEQSAVVWHTSLTLENSKDLERIQKSACKLIIGQPMPYKKYLKILDINSLHSRRSQLCMNFSLKCLKNDYSKNIFPKNKKIHNMNTRKPQMFVETKAKSERLKKSAIPQMQIMLNQYILENEKSF